MLLLQPQQLLFSGRQISLRSSGVLLGWHVIEHDDVTLLKMETVQVIERVLSLQVQ